MLPNLQVPEFKTQLPSTGEDIYFRPFLVKEEKNLLLSLESNDNDEIQNAIMNVLTSCVKTGKTSIENMAFFDVEYLFLQIRSKSVNNIVKFNLKHGSGDCDHVTPYELNLDDIKMSRDEKTDNKIMLTDTVGVVLAYPSISKAQSLVGLVNVDSNVDQIFKALANNIDYVFDTDNVYDDVTLEDKISFLEQLTKKQFDKIIGFYNSMPSLQHTIEYVCEKCSKPETIELKGLASFFG